ncbi:MULTISPECIES: hypothetical protein [Lysobacter]|uniref:Transmembrane protein n=1 Tax=Lysobacter firmicutimachus TaxID=1792846 RepID=A0ABU8D7E9_9GAMM|nr:hypothetical protein [Lysobacter antibioticus]
MHTLLVLLAGFALLGLCLLIARLAGGPGRTPQRKAIVAFVPLWLIGAGINLWAGVHHAGYSVADELPIFLLVFLLPVVAALALRWTLSRR